MAWYTTRETVKLSLDIKDTARADAQIDRLIQAHSETIDGVCRRGAGAFLPMVMTRYFDWPNQSYAPSWRIWFDEFPLASATTVTSAGVALTAGQYNLEPVNAAPPYEWVEINLGSNASWSATNTWQRAVSIAGVWSYGLDEDPAGALAASVSSTSATSITVTDGWASGAIGVGSLLRIDTERLQVTGRSWTASGWTAAALGATNSATDSTVVLSGGTAAINIGESILIDSEQMLVVDAVGSNVIVKRAWNGSVLASHSGGATVYVSRVLTVQRGVRGTTAATHSNAAPIVRCCPPKLIDTYCNALVLNGIQQERTGYARVAGEGMNSVPFSGSALSTLRSEVTSAHGRVGRSDTI